MLAITYKKITKIKVAEWGTPKNIFFLKYLLVATTAPDTVQDRIKMQFGRMNQRPFIYNATILQRLIDSIILLAVVRPIG